MLKTLARKILRFVAFVVILLVSFGAAALMYFALWRWFEPTVMPIVGIIALMLTGVIFYFKYPATRPMAVVGVALYIFAWFVEWRSGAYEGTLFYFASVLFWTTAFAKAASGALLELREFQHNN